MGELQLIGLISLILIVATIVLTYRSALNSDLKILLYVMAVLTPPIAFIVFIILNFRNRHK